MSKTKEIALIGILAALNIASRTMLQFLPNIKPVTSIIIIVTVYFGFWFGAKLSIVTSLVSDLLLGMGIFTIFHIIAWVSIALLAHLFSNVFKIKNVFILAIFSGFMGYLFGFVMSIEQLITMGYYGFIVYYLNGLLFDTLHAAGNIVFYFIFSPVLLLVFNKYFKSNSCTN